MPMTMTFINDKTTKYISKKKTSTELAALTKNLGQKLLEKILKNSFLKIC